MNDNEIIFSFLHLFGFIIAILLIYFSVLLIRSLDSEDFVVSMIFLHEKKIKSIFLVLLMGSIIFFLGHFYNEFFSNPVFINIVGLIYSLTLLYFVYGLQKILNKEVDLEYQ
jgi:hypothetical protein